ncbi:MAG: rod shape-determining protein RodA [Candidatus Wildermuthbacteria bacterium]|nr:rod shape-determining protein RodA [Candidatus Wildermuthbacteria bacterium]
MSPFAYLKKLDWKLNAAAILLVMFGLLSLYSSSLGRDDFGNVGKQAVFFAIGVALMIAVSTLDWRLLKNDPYTILFFYAVGIVLLAGIFVFAPQIRGVKTWYRVWGISIDPVEYMKIILIVLMAKFFSMRHIEMYKISHTVLSGFYVGIPAILILIQPNLGSASILLFLWIILLLVSGVRMRHFFVLLATGILIASASWSFVLKDYQKNRILSFVEPELDPLGIGWSQLQSKIAIGNGGLFGRGIGQGTQTQYGFLSEPQTDFIFAAIAEEFGTVGLLILFSLFLILIWRILRIGLDAESNFPRIFAAGFASLLIVEFSINIGMNIGFLPIVGLPLPFVSYGGSAMVMGFIGLGILQSIKVH